MIWIYTLCLLVLAAWLFFNALNERRWVQAHSHDESVASDEGLLPNFSSITRAGVLEKMSINKEDSVIASTVTKVQEKTAAYSERVLESKAVASIGEKVELMDQKIDEKIKAASQSKFLNSNEDDNSVMVRASRKMVSGTQAVSQGVAKYARNVSKGAGGEATGENVATQAAVTPAASSGTPNTANSSSGNRLNDVNEKIAMTGKKVVSRIDDSV